MTGYGFPSRYKLLKTDEFSSVFSFRRRLFGVTLALHSMPNTFGYPRIGIVVSKKVARRAVARNYMRRALREWFRHYREQISALDLVIRVNKPFDRNELAQVQGELAQLLKKLQQRYSLQQESDRDPDTNLAG